MTGTLELLPQAVLDTLTILHILSDRLSYPFTKTLGRKLRIVAMRTLKKVPEVTIFFWLIKLMTTAMGESISDFLVHQFDPIFAVALGGIGFAIAIILQFAVRRYIPWVYWLAVAMVAIFGTMAADVIHIVLGIPYVISAAFFAGALAIVFIIWYLSEKTLSIHSIYTPRREVFYWATVMTTFALGTATGDMTATTFGLGFFTSGVLFLGLFFVAAVAYWFFGLNEIFAFWFAYILTRPIGASFADWTGKSPSSGGIGIGPERVSIALAVLVIGLVAYVTVARNDILRRQNYEQPSELSVAQRPRR